MELNELRPNPLNPRKIDEEHLRMLKKSLEEFGDLGSFVFNETTGCLVSGHQRHRVLPAGAKIHILERYPKPTRTGTVALGYVVIDGEKFGYRAVRWGAEKEKAAVIAANRHGGKWDYLKLSDWLAELDSINLDFSVIGFSEEEVENICAPYRTMPPDNEPELRDAEENAPGLGKPRNNTIGAENECPKCGHRF